MDNNKAFRGYSDTARIAHNVSDRFGVGLAPMTGDVEIYDRQTINPDRTGGGLFACIERVDREWSDGAITGVLVVSALGSGCAVAVLGYEFGHFLSFVFRVAFTWLRHQ